MTEENKPKERHSAWLMIKAYFPSVTLKELESLSSEEKKELAELAAKELGWELINESANF